ncbi:MAG TPA: cobalamin-binding protein [Burkholderiales bacterium]|nr:cobalamin-binding protein [Burkholderiales bacterium]
MRLASGFVAALAALMPLAPAHAAAPIEVRDDRGVAVALEAPARRIVALAPHLAEIAYAAGAGDRLVGVSNFSDFPPEAKRLPVVFDWGRVDYERVIALRPDVVLAWRSGTPALQVERLERLGMKVVVTEVRHFADVAALERTVGRIAGTEASAETAARDFENRLAALRAEYAARPALSVFLEIWHAPMITINGDHVFSEAIELCGGRNVFARARTTTPLVSREQLLGARPDVVVTGVDVTGPAVERDAWRGLDAVPAVRAGHVYAVRANDLHRPGPRLLEGARELCLALDRAR